MIVLLRDVGQVEARFGPLGDRVKLEQDRCMVCTERAIGSEIVFSASDRTPRWHGSSGCSFWSV
jgi:hypothetical protein